MLVADEFPAGQVRHRRSHRRSLRGRIARKVRHNWRRTKLRKSVFSVILVAMAVLGGYKATMYVMNQELPSVGEFNQGNQK